MTGNCFVDTNILVYYRDASEPQKRSIAADTLAVLWEKRIGRLSFQVLNEFYVTVTRKLNPGLSHESARLDVKNLMSWNPAILDRRLIENSWFIQDHYSISWWDSLIVAAAQRLNCSILLTEDLQHEQILDGVTIINPFLTSINQIIK